MIYYHQVSLCVVIYLFRFLYLSNEEIGLSLVLKVSGKLLDMKNSLIVQVSNLYPTPNDPNFSRNAREEREARHKKPHM